MKHDTFAVTVGEGAEAFTIYYDDCGNAFNSDNAAACALSYTETGMVATVKELGYQYTEKRSWVDPINSLMAIKKLLQAEYNNGYKDGYKAGQEEA